MSSSESVPIEAIVNGTDILVHGKALLKWLNQYEFQSLSSHDELVTYCFELEVGWIFINLTYGPNDVVHRIFY